MAKDKPNAPKGDELAATADEAPVVETKPEPIPTRSTKRAGKAPFVVTALGSVKFEGKFHGAGSTLELTEEQAEALGAHVEAKKSDDA